MELALTPSFRRIASVFLEPSTSAQLRPERKVAKDWRERPTGPAESGPVSAIATATTDRGSKMLAAEIAAAVGDECGFSAALAAMEITELSAREVARLVHLSLEVEAPLIGRQLAARGAQLYASDQELQRLALVLAPPKVTRMTPRQESALARNREWLMHNGGAYRGQWVALQSGELVAVASSTVELARKLRQIAWRSALDTLIAQVQ